MRKLDRRRWFQLMSAGAFGGSVCPWLPAIADEVATNPKRRRHCILLWMTGGPSQTDTFDMKPDHAHGGEFKQIETNVSGVRICEHLPKLSLFADHLAIVRSLSTKEGDHGRGTYLMRTGHQPMGPVRYPTIGSSLSKELSGEDDTLNFVSIAPYRQFNPAAFGPGFLGPRFAPLTVGDNENLQAAQAAEAGNARRYAALRVDDLKSTEGVSSAQFDARLRLWRSLQDSFLASHPTASPLAHDTVYRRAVKLMHSELPNAFDLSEEPDDVRDAYGRGRFGQGCLMARKLIERGVAFVEVSLGSFSNGALGWDTHQNNFSTLKSLCAELDSGWSALMSDLQSRGLLESTTILWMGEFGRTPKINPTGGRDHFPAAWSCVLGGGGIRGGQVYGRTSADGTQVEDQKADVGDILATLCTALGIPPERQNVSEVGRPIKIAEGTPIKEILA